MTVKSLTMMTKKKKVKVKICLAIIMNGARLKHYWIQGHLSIQFDSDYQANPRLDNYNIDEIDDGMQSELSIGDRLAVDTLLDRRDRQRMRAEGRLPAAFLEGLK